MASIDILVLAHVCTLVFRNSHGLSIRTVSEPFFTYAALLRWQESELALWQNWGWIKIGARHTRELCPLLDSSRRAILGER